MKRLRTKGQDRSSGVSGATRAWLLFLGGLPTAALLAVGSGGSIPAATGPNGAAAPSYEKEIRPLLDRYCLGCHGAEKPKADLSLAAFPDEPSVLKARRTWKKVLDVLHAREMPPEGKPQPPPAERDRLTDWIETVLSRPAEDGSRDPGPPIVRRLTRVEYNNSVYDLFGIFKPGTYFQPGKGMPETVRLVLHRNQRPALVDLPPDDIDHGYTNIAETLSLPLFLMEKYVAAARQVTAIALGEEALDRRGKQRSRVFNLLPNPKPDRETARRILTDLATRAFRRPTPTAEVERYLKLFDLAAQKGEAFDNALKVPVQAILVSPHFLFRIETGDPSREEKGVRPLTDHELASRLSYFLWSSMPDAELLALAGQGKLRDPAVLEQQARRMLRSPRAKELAENFAMQWLQLEGLAGATPDPDRFPAYYRLRYPAEAMRQEALLLFEAVMIEDRSILDLVDADFAYLNSIMAQFYGVGGPEVLEQNASLYWRRYALTDKRRGGVLTLAGVLTATSTSTRTSPVKRGKWVLETLLGAPPPPPLANVADLDDSNPVADGLTLRQKLERHRSDPNCASCHARMDPIGLGLENYNAIGAWRDKEGAQPIDAFGKLSDGSTFNGPVELKKLLLTGRKDDFVRCLTEHLLTYALSRRLDYYDTVTVKEIGRRLAGDEYKFSTLVVEIVKSYPFRNIRAGEGNEAETKP